MEAGGCWNPLRVRFRDKDGDVSKLVIVNRDITERKRAEERLEYNLFHDALTGLPNRRMFIDRLQSAFARVRRDPGAASCQHRSFQGL